MPYSKKLTQFQEQHKENPMFVVKLRYMDMVLTLLEFIHATRDEIWPLHLSSMEGLCQHFFANNRLKYAQMVPLYLAEVKRVIRTSGQSSTRGNSVSSKVKCLFAASVSNMHWNT